MSVNRRLAATTVHFLPEHRPLGSAGQILAGSLKLFAERGYGSASVLDIAAAAGVKPATIYAHYPSKEHILAELCRIGHEEQYRGVREAVLGSRPDPLEQVVAYVQAHVGFHTTFPMLAVVSNAELHVLGDALGAETFALRRQSEQLLTDIIRRGVNQAIFHVPNVWLAVAAIGGMGLWVAYWYAPDYHIPPEQVADGYSEFALRLLAAPEGTTPRKDESNQHAKKDPHVA
jgi:AcrR family transcriptional regulator